MQSSRSAVLARSLRGACRSSPAPTARITTRCQSTSQRPQLAGLLPQRPTLVSTSPIAFSAAARNQSQLRHGSSAAAPAEPLDKTPLYDLHLAHGAKMVPFGGFHMPVQYSGLSVSQSHVFTREHSSLFDVSHMVQRIFSGPGAAKFLERITPSDLHGLGVHNSTLSTLMHADGSGGIVDDTILMRLPRDQFYVVTNAGCRAKDNAYLDAELAKWNSEHADLQVTQKQLDGQGLVALQGPDAAAVLTEVLADKHKIDLASLHFGSSLYAQLKIGAVRVSTPVLISRGGYTGEDGFEISIPTDETVAVTEALLAKGGPERVQLAGLGARDSLRLEAGMCLYGHDLDDSTTPVEAALSWIIPKHRRSADAGYYGADVLAAQLTPKSKGGSGVTRRRVGLLVEGAPAREGAVIVARAEGKGGDEPTKLGIVTSGCPSPTLGKNIAMGYIQDGFHKAGTEVDVLVRGRPRKAVVAKMPFVPTRYWKGT